MASNESGGTGIDPVLEVLIAQLWRAGVLDHADIANMKRRLIEGGDADKAESLGFVILSDAFDDPALRRATIHSLDGGNGGD